MVNSDKQRTTGLTIAEVIHGFVRIIFASDFRFFETATITAKDTEYITNEITIPITNAINHSITENHT